MIFFCHFIDMDKTYEYVVPQFIIISQNNERFIISRFNTYANRFDTEL